MLLRLPAASIGTGGKTCAVIPVPHAGAAEALAKALGPTVARKLQEFREQDEPKRLVELLGKDHPAARKLLYQPGALMELWAFSQTGEFSEEAMIEALKPITKDREEAEALAAAIREHQWQAVPEKRRVNFELKYLLSETRREVAGSGEQVVARLEAAIRGLSRQLPQARQLPAQTTPFGDRGEALERAEDLLDERPAGNVARILTATGMVGIGKSALAIEVAYRHLEEYPGAVLYLDLAGIPTSQRGAADLAARLLRDLGVAPEAIHSEGRARLGQLQSLYAESPVLLVIDNADPSSQLQGLIPANRECVVLVSCTAPVSSLPSARSLPLGQLREDEAFEVLAGLLDRPLGDEIEAAREIVTRCGGLPLCLAVIAGRIRAAAGLTLAQHARGMGSDLDALQALDDDQETLRVALTGAIEAASPGARRSLLLVSALEVTDLEPELLAALSGCTDREAIEVLAELSRRALIMPLQGGGFQVHGLLRAVAARLARESLADDEVASAQARRVQWLSESGRRLANDLDGEG
jgi:NB-ARC domain